MTIWQSTFIIKGIKESFIKLNPLILWRNIGNVCCRDRLDHHDNCDRAIYIIEGQSYSLSLQVSIWLWATVLFANFAEALAEIQGKARAESLRSTRNQLNATKIAG